MLLPTGDTPNPRNFTAYVNWALIAVNCFVFVVVSLPLMGQGVDLKDPRVLQYLDAMRPSMPAIVSLHQVLAKLTAYDLFVFEHGYKTGAPEITDLLFSMFLHGGLWHLAGNMLFLWIYGDNVEHRLGRAGYLITYLATGIAATLFYSAFADSSMVPLVGASGAISGVLGIYFLLFPRNKVKVFVFFFPFIMNTFLIPARIVLGFYLVIDNLFPFILGSASSVAYGAHIGGFLAGLVVAGMGERAGWRAPWGDSFKRAAVSGRVAETEKVLHATPLDALRAALVRGDSSRALSALGDLDRAAFAKLEPEECLQLGVWLEDAGYPGAAVRILRGCVARHPTHPSLANVYLALGLMRLRQGQPTAAYQHLLSVFDHKPSPEAEQKARNALEDINVYKSKRRER